jgi:hypothetical protein
MFLRDAGILNGHFPAAKINELAAQLLVRGKQRGAFQHESHNETTALKKKNFPPARNK